MLCDLLRVGVSKATICRTIKRLGYARVKKIGRSRRKRRAAWRVTVSAPTGSCTDAVKPSTQVRSGRLR